MTQRWPPKRIMKWALWTVALVVSGMALLVAAILRFSLIYYIDIKLKNETGAPLLVERVSHKDEILTEGVILYDSLPIGMTFPWPDPVFEITLRRPGRGESEKHTFRLDPGIRFEVIDACRYTIVVRPETVDAKLNDCIPL